MTHSSLELRLVREGYAPSEGYAGVGVGGLEPAEITAAFLPEDGTLLVLECGSCGEWGCWPGEMTIALEEGTVTWRALRNRHRPTWTYPGVGPFTFDRAQYEAAVATLVAELEAARD